uniref:NADPH oxidase 4 n=1 Tax=Gorilla gorilla gorilla TaxID=9595 RepID=G3QL27_GORGO
MAVSWRSWLANEGVKHLCLFIWLSMNVLLFWKTFLLYNQGPEYHYLHQMLGLGLCLSRASASVLNLNCSLILLPMCRTLLAYLRGSQKVPSRRTRRLLDKSRTFHITCGVTICIFSGVHVAAHLVNALNFSVNYIPGLTGVCMVVVLFLMITASTYAIRVSNYDIFWYTHNLFFVFYMLLTLHVSGGLLKYQTNLDTHPPGCISLNRTSSQNISLPEYFSEHFHEPFPEGFSKPAEFTQHKFVKICVEEPRFQANFPQVRLILSLKMCLMNLGAPILSCPSLSFLIFAGLKSCPTETKATFGVHLKIVGDWTARERLNDLWRNFQKYTNSLIFVFAILITIMDDWKPYKLRRLYFIWVCRDIQSFRWFADLLCMLHNKFWQENRPDYVNIQLYLSQTDGIQKIIGEKYHALNSRLFIGRPRWKLLFDEIAKYNR